MGGSLKPICNSLQVPFLVNKVEILNWKNLINKIQCLEVGLEDNIKGIEENKISESDYKREINQDKERRQKTTRQESLGHIRLLRKILKIWNPEREGNGQDENVIRSIDYKVPTLYLACTCIYGLKTICFCSTTSSPGSSFIHDEVSFYRRFSLIFNITDPTFVKSGVGMMCSSNFYF